MGSKVNSKLLKNKEKSASIALDAGSFLAQKRVEANISLLAVAKYMGVSLSLLKSYEEGAKAIPLHQIYAYSNLLNISPDEILALLDKSYRTKLKRVK